MVLTMIRMVTSMHNILLQIFVPNGVGDISSLLLSKKSLILNFSISDLVILHIHIKMHYD